MINCLRRNGAHWRFFSISKLFPRYENMITFHFFYIFIRVENHLISGVIYISSRFDNLTRFHYPAPPPPHPSRLLRGICPPCQSRWWGICKFCATRGPGICQPRGYSQGGFLSEYNYKEEFTGKNKLIGSSEEGR